MARAEGGRIVLLVMDGVGGLQLEGKGGSELQVARTPNLDRLAARSSCGLLDIVGPGITPGSGPGHLALFGYDPLRYVVGRGVLGALGIDFDLQAGDVAARVNFCTVDGQGLVVDRRAGRIDDATNRRLAEMIRSQVSLEGHGVRLFFDTEKEHRAVLVLRGKDLSDQLLDTDPQRTGEPPLPVRAASADAGPTAAVVEDFIAQARRVLAAEPKTNMLLLRGFGKYHPFPGLKERFRLSGVAIADYPMYRGVSRLVGMEAVPPPGGMEQRFETLERLWGHYDYYFLHIKHTDSRGEDANFEAKVAAIEEVDRLLPRIERLAPDVLIVTGDHSTPAAMGRHSWHPVPVLISSRWSTADDTTRFDE
ncbi:MAG: 2,3-bisphosphoglycerate-independent phosphoglycerate mutase, partial [Pseudomonadota bacterium]